MKKSELKKIIENIINEEEGQTMSFSSLPQEIKNSLVHCSKYIKRVYEFWSDSKKQSFYIDVEGWLFNDTMKALGKFNPKTHLVTIMPNGHKIKINIIKYRNTSNERNYEEPYLRGREDS